MKKQPSKVAHNSQPAIFFITGLAAQKATNLRTSSLQKLKFTVVPKETFGTWKFGKISVLVNFIIQN